MFSQLPPEPIKYEVELGGQRIPYDYISTDPQDETRYGLIGIFDYVFIDNKRREIGVPCYVYIDYAELSEEYISERPT